MGNQGGIENQGPGEMEVFPAFHPVPFSKMLTFFKNDTFQVAGEYVTDVPYPVRHIGLFEIGVVKPTADGGNQKVKVKVRVNPNGIFGVSSASLLEKHEIEEEVPVEMDVDNKENGEKKEYIYEIRGKLCEELEDFMVEEDRNKFSLELEDAENWLYEDGEYAEKVEYSQKLTQLKTKGEAVKKRRHEFNERPGAINQFGQCLQLAQKAVDSYKAGDDKFSHLDQAEVEKVQKAIGEKQEWFSRMCAEIQKLQKTSDPPVLASQFFQEKGSFWHMASNILNKPKPKVEPPPPAPADTPATKEESMDTPSDNTNASEPNLNGEASKDEAKVNEKKVPDMDVD